MIELSTGFVDQVAAPPLAPIELPIDVNHLSRMTLGDASLEREVLQLYDRQAGMLLARMRQAEPAGAAAYAHTLKGSSHGIGAWRVARASEVVEFAANSGGPADIAMAVGGLAAAIDEVRVVIADMLRSN